MKVPVWNDEDEVELVRLQTEVVTLMDTKVNKVAKEQFSNAINALSFMSPEDI